MASSTIHGGLHILSQGTDPVSTDVVFVHGLQSDAFKAWTEVSSATCWPKDLLPKDLPNTRLMTWSYDSSVVGSIRNTSINSLFNHANNLLSDLERERWNHKDRRLVFVGHSLGGLLIKQALIRANSILANKPGSDDTGLIYAHTVGVIFLATPHCGVKGKGYSLSRTLVQVVKHASGGHKSQLLDNLEQGSDVLDSQREEFATISEKMGIHCFFEEKPTATGGYIVERDSAKMPGASIKNHSIPEDHENMCKFAEREHIGYQRVLGSLQRLCTDSMSMRQHEAAQKIIETLAFDNMDYRHNDIAKAHEKTFEWLFESKDSGFPHWLQEGDEIYWINGKAGSGKSTLMKFVYDDQRTREILGCSVENPRRILAGYFFHRRGSFLQKSHTGVLRSILAQVLIADETLASYALPVNWHTEVVSKSLTRDSFWTVTKLREALKKLCRPLVSGVSICLLIDGLDEFDGDLEDLTRFLLDLTQCPENQKSPIKACIASRPLPLLTQAFQMCPGLRLQDLTEEDITLVISGTLMSEDSKELLASYDESEVQWLVQEIAAKASGVFLWVTFVCRSLQEGLREGDTLDELKAKLSRLPPDLEELFRHTLNTIRPEHKQHATEIFEIVRHADEPLSLLKLSIALDGPEAALKRSLDATPRKNVISKLKIMHRRIGSRCAGLIESDFDFDSNSVAHRNEDIHEFWAYEELASLEFIHETARALFESHCPWALLGIDRPHGGFDANVALLGSVLGCLKETHSSEVYEAGQEGWHELIMEFAFYVRAAEASTKQSQRRFIKELDRIESTRSSPPYTRLGTPKIHWSGILYEPGQQGRDCQPCDSLMSFAVAMGFSNFVEEEIKTSRYKGTTKRPLLHFAVSPYRISDGDRVVRVVWPRMVKVLLDHGVDVNKVYKERSAWQIALNNIANKPEEMDFSSVEEVSQEEKETTWLEVLELLVDYGADANAPVLHVKQDFTKEDEHTYLTPLDVISDVYRNGPWEKVGRIIYRLFHNGGIFRDPMSAGLLEEIREHAEESMLASGTTFLSTAMGEAEGPQ